MAFKLAARFGAFDALSDVQIDWNDVMDDQQAVTVIEAALLCADGPMSVGAVQKLFDPEQVTEQQVAAWLETIQIAWQDRGLELAQTASGWRFQSRVAMQRYLERLNPEQTPKYSRAVLETLAIIAWKQPVTRGDIEAIRGVTVSSQIIKTLEDRGWIETIGHRDGPGRPALLGTTKQFLDDLGLRALDELPPLQMVAQEQALGVELALGVSEGGADATDGAERALSSGLEESSAEEVPHDPDSITVVAHQDIALDSATELVSPDASGSPEPAESGSESEGENANPQPVSELDNSASEATQSDAIISRPVE